MHCQYALTTGSGGEVTTMPSEVDRAAGRGILPMAR